MEIKLLGAHQGQSRDIGFISILVDGRLAIDAGGLTTALTLEEQEQIEAVIVTHQHFDHIQNLVGLAHNNWGSKSLHIYCIAETRKALQAHIFNDVLWPTMLEARPGIYPLVWHDVEVDVPFDLMGYRITPFEVSHTVPTVGYHIERDGKSFIYTADTRATGNPGWAAFRPDLLLVETTMANEYENLAYTFGHMTPSSLGQELRVFHARQGYYPRTVCVHINPHHEAAVKPQLAALAKELGADIKPGNEGMTLRI